MTGPILVPVALGERIRRELSPSRVIAGISTTVAVVAVGALLWVVGQDPAGPTVESPKPAVVASVPVEHVQPIAAHPTEPAAAEAAAPVAPSPKPSAPPASMLPATGGTTRSSDTFNHTAPIFGSPPDLPAEAEAPAVPAEAEAPAVRAEAPAISWPWFDSSSVPPLDPFGSSAQSTASTIASAISGPVGGVGGGVLDVLGAIITASTYASQSGGTSTPNGLASLLLPSVTNAGLGLPGLPSFDLTKLPPPPSFDLTKLPPPPSFDLTKLPPLPPPPPLPSLGNPLAMLPSPTRAIGLPF
ncbi:hypothetical protein [Mycobacterium sp. OTB74]|uniref:hypothetical protein n=1 Tax=Mycobacterium sp. OTB74 TaxID=1853452 RepID=UPI0024758CFC|nr:hypothetical protein [Mycobacterium sp. OTB74]